MHDTLAHSPETAPRSTRSAALGARAILFLAAPLLVLVLAREAAPRLTRALYLPVHTALELLVVAVALAIFGVQWFAAREFREARARFLGPAFLSVAVLETLHILVFPGMPGFAGEGTTERGIYYWLLSRLFTVGALVWAARIPRESENPLLRREVVLVLNGALVATLVLVEVALPNDRAFFFVEGRGLTAAKIAIELVVGAAAVAGAFLHARAWRRTGDGTSRTLASALAVTALSEACFTLYRHPYDLFNVVGHLYLLLSVWFVFDALFVAGVVRPYRELDALRGHVQNELHVTIDRLRRLTEQREDLLRAVSHDLKNPLQIVMLQAQRLQRGKANAEASARAVNTILTAGRRMDRMLRDLADAARLEAGTLKLAPTEVDLRAFVAELLDLSEGVFEAARVRNLVPPALPAVRADPDRLDRILVNLVGNALKYSQGGVIVRASHEPGFVRVEIEDSGPGIAPEDLSRIFQRFYRGQRHEGEGLGLGLYIVRKLVEAHGGSAGATSVVGKGSTFSFTLPSVAGR
jgi:signal transduction histidine kinase